MTHLVIHIGAGKCGSSAIQNHLRIHAASLRDAGVLVPDEELGADRSPAGQQIAFFESLRQLKPRKARRLWQAKCRHLFDVAHTEDLSTVLFSAENLSNPTGTALLLGRIDADVKIVFYVRRQLDYLVSAWQQWYLKTHHSPGHFLDEQLGVIANWNLSLADWESTFGAENIEVRRYGRGLLHGGDVVADFVHATRLPVDAPRSATELVNSSFSDAITAIAMRCPDQFASMHDNGFYISLASLVGDLAYRGTQTTFPFTAADVDRIEAAYVSSNEAIAKKYFPDLDEPLFASAAAGIMPADAEELRNATIALLDEAILRLSTMDSFDRAPAADFARLLEGLRSTT